MSDITREYIVEHIEQHAPDEFDDLLIADGFEQAFLGLAFKFSNMLGVAYSRNKCLEILVERDGMSPDEAEEYFQFNVEGAYVGEYTPVFIC
jgi:hypothetical protein